MQAQKRLSDSVKNVNALQSKIDGYNKANAAIQQNQQKLQRLTAEHDRLQSELAQTAQKKRDLQRAMETAEAEGNIEEYKRLQKELSDTNKEYSRLNEKYKANQNQIQQATDKIEEQQRSLEELAQELREAGLNTDDLERANERLKNSYERLQASQERLKNLNQQQEKIKQNISATKTQILGTAGAYTTVAAAIYAGPIKSSMAFEKQMSNVGTLLEGDVQGRLAELSKSIISISNATGAGTGDLTDGLYQVISAFGDTADSAKILETATKAATAGGATTTDAINLLSAVTKGYGDTSAEAQQKVADWAFSNRETGANVIPGACGFHGEGYSACINAGCKAGRFVRRNGNTYGCNGQYCGSIDTAKSSHARLFVPVFKYAKIPAKAGICKRAGFAGKQGPTGCAYRITGKRGRRSVSICKTVQFS